MLLSSAIDSAVEGRRVDVVVVMSRAKVRRDSILFYPPLVRASCILLHPSLPKPHYQGTYSADRSWWEEGPKSDQSRHILGSQLVT